MIGEERSLFAFYLLNGGSFAGCLGTADAKIAVATQATALERLLAEKLERDLYSGLLEHVANELAKRLPDYAAGLSPEVLRAFDQPEQRRNYIEMQRVLADDGVGYEVALSRPGYQPSPTDHQAGTKLYGHLRTESRSFGLAP